MVYLRIQEILTERGLSRYFLWSKMGMMSYRNFKNIIEGKTISIRFEILETISKILDLPVGLLYAQDDDEGNRIWPTTEVLELYAKKNLLKKNLLRNQKILNLNRNNVR